tara:strand:- start:995 stop:1948 length:954 start_codon:yes stop_codon:yes gene_type:complete
MNSAFLNFLAFLWTTAGNNQTWRKFLYRQLRRNGKTPDYAFSKDFYGLKYKGNLNNNIDANVFFYGAFEKPLLFFLRDTLNALITETPKAIFMDIGANVGHHSIFLSKFASQVLAFEPYPKVNMQFKQQIAHNNISNIQIFETGLSDRRETLNYYAPTGNNEGIGSFDESSIGKGNTSYGKLELQEGDQVIESDSWKNIKLIKIDVEGFEKKVIKGLSRTIEEERPVIVCEITYGQQLSFVSIEELSSYLPQNYEILTFNTRKLDGSKDKRKGSLAKRSGFYELISLKQWRSSGQDDIVMIPNEKSTIIPRQTEEHS